jgi:hypothetical protein
LGNRGTLRKHQRNKMLPIKINRNKKNIGSAKPKNLGAV